jgi:hypothetical protein
VTPKSNIGACRGEAHFRDSDLLSTGSDDTLYSLITTEGDSKVEGSKAQSLIKPCGRCLVRFATPERRIYASARGSIESLGP